MDKHLEEFLQATDRCTEQLQEMLPLEQEKYQALISDDVLHMEEMVQAQQAAIMKLKNLEAARMDCQQKAGFGHQSADEILESIPQEDRAVFVETFVRLRNSAQELRLCNEKAMEIARASALFWQSLDSGIKPPVADKVTYGSKGNAPAKIGNGALFQIKI